MPLVSSMAGQNLDNVYVLEIPAPPTIQGVKTGVVALLGTFQQGIPTGIYSISDYPTAVRLLGTSTAGLGGSIALQNLLRQQCAGIQVVPVFGSSASAASVSLYDAQTTPGELGTLTAAQAHPQSGVMTPLLGSGPNSWTVSVTQPSTPNNTFNLTITAGASVERYTGLTAANWAATVSAATKLVIVTQPTTPSGYIAAAGNFAFANGSVGALSTSAELDAAMIGQVNADGTSVGLALFQTLAIASLNFILASEYSSSAVNTALATFAAAQNCVAVLCAPQGSTVATTIAAQTFSQDNVCFCDGWATCYDNDLASNRTCAPNALVAGMASQLPPQQSLGNKTIYGTQGVAVARSNADLSTLQTAGVLCLSNAIPRGGFGTRSGIASDGSDVFVRRMRYYLEYSIMNAMGWAVDALQSVAANDPLRAQVAQSIATFLSGLANPSDPTLKIIDSYTVTCNTTNNTPTSIEAGQLNVSVVVRLLAAAKQIVISANISTSAQTVSSTVG